MPTSLAGRRPQLSREPNIFTEEQEVDLGDAIAEQIQRDFRVIDDGEVTGHLRRIGERIVKHLPPTKLRFQFFLVDLSEANAFVLPGGRIYVSRKMVAFAQSEDELAAVIAHEIGHLVARQQSVTMTRRLKEALGVTQVTDRRDIFDKYNLLVENAARKPEVFRRGDNHEGKDQIEADQIGLFALAPPTTASLAATLRPPRRDEGQDGQFLLRPVRRDQPGIEAPARDDQGRRGAATRLRRSPLRRADR